MRRAFIAFRSLFFTAFFLGHTLARAQGPITNRILFIFDDSYSMYAPWNSNIKIEVAKRVMAWEDTIEKNPSDPEALAALGTHLFEQDAYHESRELLARAMKYDVRRPLEERKRSRLLLGAIEKSDHRYAEAETILNDALALPPSPEHDAKVLYVLGRMYDAWGRKDEARLALQKVVKTYGQTSIAQKARESLVALEK